MRLFGGAFDDAKNSKPQRYHDEPHLLEGSNQDDEALDFESNPDAPLNNGYRSHAHQKGLGSRLAEYVPRRIRDAGIAIADWTKGPDPPRIWAIRPVLPVIQEAPIRLLDRYFPRKLHRFFLLILLYATWLLCLIVILRKSSFAEEIPGYGAPKRIDCGQSFWSPKNNCGLNGQDCLPFSNQTLTFRCPANCIKTWVLEPRAVGDEEVIYRPLVVGGAPEESDNTVEEGVYRADSFICNAAIHAGYITNSEGGCGVVELLGEHSGYAGSNRQGVASTAFDSSFPKSYRFVKSATTSCRDLRWPLLAITVTCTSLLSLFTTSSSVFFFSTFTAIYLHVSLVSDPPDLASYSSLLSLSLGGLLPSLFVMYVMYTHFLHRTLDNLTAQVEKTVLWLGACWIGALNNETFDQRIPIQRLTPHDIAQQPGAVPALIFIILLILGIALGQAWAIRIEGRMRPYLALYGAMVGGILVLLMIPGMNLRIHHYIIGILLLPGTGLQTRPCLVYQGLLVGLFINGVARWGYASILASPAELLNDAQLGSALPFVLAPHIQGLGGMLQNITFNWTWPPANGLGSGGTSKFDGVSVLVNDVERFRGYPEGEDLEFTWSRDEGDRERPEFFRFAYMKDELALDYTKAGRWEADGGWTPMLSGPSK